MGTAAPELYELGLGVFDTFKVLHSAAQGPEQHRIEVEEQKFRLWAHSLGLHQQGHASLDYRVRDAPVVKTGLVDILSDLQESLGALLSILSGERPPGEDACPKTEEDTTDAQLLSEHSAEGETRSEVSESVELASSSSDGSFHEVQFRLECVEDLIDGLYSLATRIRNPKNRPQRRTVDLYGHVPESRRAQYMQEREEVETAVVAYTQRQQLLEAVRRERLDIKSSGLSEDGMLEQYTSPSSWIIRRTGVANARRRQQFVYWKEHAERISKGPGHDAPRAPTEDSPLARQDDIIPADGCPPGMNLDVEQAVAAPAPTIATSATKLEERSAKPDDQKSAISHQSRVSTAVDIMGDKLVWPPPPQVQTINRFFTCPYCKIICPERYLTRDLWRIHLIHDLQAYHCTYEDCPDMGRLYSSRQDWLDHESQHTRVWHCQLHGEEFETQPEYTAHLDEHHPHRSAESDAPELTATVVGPSSSPQRDCPFCPTAFDDTAHMQKHVSFHLERLALFTLPAVEDDEEGDDDDDHDDRHGSISDSHVAHRRRGRRVSVDQDFRGILALDGLWSTSPTRGAAGGESALTSDLLSRALDKIDLEAHGAASIRNWRLNIDDATPGTDMVDSHGEQAATAAAHENTTDSTQDDSQREQATNPFVDGTTIEIRPHDPEDPAQNPQRQAMGPKMSEPWSFADKPFGIDSFTATLSLRVFTGDGRRSQMFRGSLDIEFSPHIREGGIHHDCLIKLFDPLLSVGPWEDNVAAADKIYSREAAAFSRITDPEGLHTPQFLGTWTAQAAQPGGQARNVPMMIFAGSYGTFLSGSNPGPNGYLSRPLPGAAAGGKERICLSILRAACFFEGYDVHPAWGPGDIVVDTAHYSMEDLKVRFTGFGETEGEPFRGPGGDPDVVRAWAAARLGGGLREWWPDGIKTVQDLGDWAVRQGFRYNPAPVVDVFPPPQQKKHSFVKTLLLEYLT